MLNSLDGTLINESALTIGACRTPDGGSQMTPLTPGNGNQQHVPFTFSSPLDAANNGSPRHSIASNQSSGLSNPPSPSVAGHVSRDRNSYESWAK